MVLELVAWHMSWVYMCIFHNSSVFISTAKWAVGCRATVWHSGWHWQGVAPNIVATVVHDHPALHWDGGTMDDVGSSGGQEPGILHQTVAKQIKICVCLLRTDTCLSCRSEKELGQSLQYWEECFSLNSEVVPTCLQPMADKVSVCVCVCVCFCHPLSPSMCNLYVALVPGARSRQVHASHWELWKGMWLTLVLCSIVTSHFCGILSVERCWLSQHGWGVCHTPYKTLWPIPMQFAS